MEYASRGSLREYLDMQTQPLSKDLVCSLIGDIAVGMKYLYSHNIEHRDLKASNILLNEHLRVKICDFGISKGHDLETRTKCWTKDIGGTVAWKSPEEFDDVPFNEKCDVWSIGVMLYILLSGKPPFDGQNDQEITEKVCFVPW